MFHTVLETPPLPRHPLTTTLHRYTVICAVVNMKRFRASDFDAAEKNSRKFLPCIAVATERGPRTFRCMGSCLQLLLN